MSQSILKQFHNRQILPEHSAVPFARCQQVTSALLRRLYQQAELNGHSGCVNCLEWNERGSLLASGSDDVRVILWDPFRQRSVHTINTSHRGNIFSVKFLPSTDDKRLVSGAADWRILVHDVTRKEAMLNLACHSARVKRLATSVTEPNLFWSAAEDGTIMEHDVRGAQRETVLVNLNAHLGSGSEAKCLALNPTRPHLLAVGANDPYVRLYDRRKMNLQQQPLEQLGESSSSDWSRSSVSERLADWSVPDEAAKYYVPGHLPQKTGEFRRGHRTLAATYVTFSPSGEELLVNLGGEQIYLYNVSRRRHVMATRLPTKLESSTPMNGVSGAHVTSNTTPADEAEASDRADAAQDTANGLCCAPDAGKRKPKRPKHDSVRLPARAELYKQQANSEFERGQYTQSIRLYSEALALAPHASVLYGNRAAAFMKRNWDGDVYAALRDCHSAIHVDPSHVKAHFRLARCLHELGWETQALDCLQIFRSKFSEYTKSHACEALERDIRAALSSETAETTERRSARDRREVTSQERQWRQEASDYEHRFCGHCNTTTDIKEANFFGSEGRYVIAGSDDGSFFCWDKNTENIVQVLRGDESIVNCLQPHPTSCVLATSGIDPVVRIWSPRPEDGTSNERAVPDSISAAAENQARMKEDPLEGMLYQMGYHIRPSDDSGEEMQQVQCRTS